MIQKQCCLSGMLFTIFKYAISWKDKIVALRVSALNNDRIWNVHIPLLSQSESTAISVTHNQKAEAVKYTSILYS